MKINNSFPDVEKSLVMPKTMGIWKWHFPESRLGETVMINGVEVKKMLTLDINIPEDSFVDVVNGAPLALSTKVFAKNYPCPHACPGCFNNAKVHNTMMTLKEVIGIVDQALELGLESVKFLGPGELLANPKLFEILDALRERNIVIGIFTKGAIMGSDFLAQKYHGINSAELVEKLVSYDNTTFLIGGRSFDPKIENKFIPTRDPKLRKHFNYHEARNVAIERLCDAGMNSDPEKQRLSIQTIPVTEETLDGVLEIFKWATDRNIPSCVTTTMVSGKGHKYVKNQQGLNFETRYKKLVVGIYSYLLEKKITTISKLESEGISSYVGMAPCNQLTHGLYIHYDGEVWMCPGNDTQDFIVYNNVREGKLLDIWLNSKNYKINKFNNGCVKDGITIPDGFYKDIFEQLKLS